MAAKLCNVCNIRKVGTKGSDPLSAKLAGMCGLCMDEGGWENTHSDEGHEEATIATPELTNGCWICHPELNEAANWKPSQPKAAPASKATYVRRPQLNHKGHSHPATSVARRACKEAFWSWAASTDGPKELAAEHFSGWNHTCDAQGKPSKGPKVFVAPLGAKGGVSAGKALVKAKTAKPHMPDCLYPNDTHGKCIKSTDKFLTKAEGQKLYGK